MLFRISVTVNTHLRHHDSTSEPPPLVASHNSRKPAQLAHPPSSPIVTNTIQHGRQGAPRTRQLLLLVLLQGRRLWHARLLPQHLALRLVPVLKKATGTCILQLRAGPAQLGGLHANAAMSAACRPRRNTADILTSHRLNRNFAVERRADRQPRPPREENPSSSSGVGVDWIRSASCLVFPSVHQSPKPSFLPASSMSSKHTIRLATLANNKNNNSNTHHSRDRRKPFVRPSTSRRWAPWHRMAWHARSS